MTMTTRIRFEHNAVISAAHLAADDGGSAFVFCAIPGGRPQFQLSPQSTEASPVVNAPQCDTRKEFMAFVTERFGGEA